MRAFDTLRHPGGSTGVEDGRQTLGWIIQPGRRLDPVHGLRQPQDVDRRQVAESLQAPSENDHRRGVLEHVADQRLGQTGVEEHHGAASLENAEVGGDDLPVVLRHGDGHDLVWTGKKGREGGGNVLGPGIELAEGQGLTGVWNLESSEVGESLGGSTEHVGEPLDPFLM